MTYKIYQVTLGMVFKSPESTTMTCKIYQVTLGTVANPSLIEDGCTVFKALSKSDKSIYKLQIKKTKLVHSLASSNFKQWRSEIPTGMNFEWSKIGWSEF